MHGETLKYITLLTVTVKFQMLVQKGAVWWMVCTIPCLRPICDVTFTEILLWTWKSSTSPNSVIRCLQVTFCCDSCWNFWTHLSFAFKVPIWKKVVAEGRL